MNQARQNVRSKKAMYEHNKETSQTDESIHIVIHTIIDKMYSDQAVRFPVMTRKGYKYMMILYHYKTNAILAEPLKSRQDKDMIQAYNNIICRLTKHQKLPSLHLMNNEASVAFKVNLKTPYQLVPTHTNQRKRAEVAIKTFKQHFIAIFSGTQKLFPLHLWCRLITHAEMTADML